MRLNGAADLMPRLPFLSTTTRAADVLLESPERFAERTRRTEMDVLSEVLKVVKLQGAVYFNGEFSAPWSIFSPRSEKIAPYVGAPTGRVIIYHLLTEGKASIRTMEGERLQLEAGDIIVFPHGDSHFVEHGAATTTIDNSQNLGPVFAQGLKAWR